MEGMNDCEKTGRCLTEIDKSGFHFAPAPLATHLLHHKVFGVFVNRSLGFEPKGFVERCFNVAVVNLHHFDGADGNFFLRTLGNVVEGVLFGEVSYTIEYGHRVL